MRCQCTTCRPAAFVVGIRTRVNNVLVRSAELRCTHLSKPKRNLNLNLVESASFERSSALMLLTQGIRWIYFSSEMISSLGPHDPTLGIQLNSHSCSFSYPRLGVRISRISGQTRGTTQRVELITADPLDFSVRSPNPVRARPSTPRSS